MNFEVKKLTLENPLDLEMFYYVGEQIRTAVDSYRVPFSEEKNITRVFKDENLRAFALIINESTSKARLISFTDSTNPGTGFIGWYECDKNEEVHNKIISEAFNWLKENQCTKVVGPLNGNTWNNYRFNLSADYPLFPSEPYQPTYYPEFWKISGFENLLNYTTELPPRSVVQPMTFDQVSLLLASHDFQALNLTNDVSDYYSEKLHQFYHLCFSGNPLFHPISLEEYQLVCAKTTQILNSDHSFLILDKADEIAAVFISFNDYYHIKFGNEINAPVDYKTKKLVIKTLAVHPDYRNKQIGTLMINYIHHLAYENGYEQVIHALMYDDNISAKKGKEKFQTEVIRKYALMEMAL